MMNPGTNSETERRREIAYNFGRIFGACYELSGEARGVEKLRRLFAQYPARWIGPVLRMTYIGAASIPAKRAARLDAQICRLMDKIPAAGFAFPLDNDLQAALFTGEIHEREKIAQHSTKER